MSKNGSRKQIASHLPTSERRSNSEGDRLVIGVRWNGSYMDRDKELQLIYTEVLKALEKARSRLKRPPTNDRDAHHAQASGMFHLGVAGGLAFSGHLPGIKSDALFDDISDSAELRDVREIGQIRRTVRARLSSDRPPDERSPSRSHLDWDAGALQMLAVLNEARSSREKGDVVRYSLMVGFLVGLMSEMSRWGIRYGHGSLKDAVLAAHDRYPKRARTWVASESIEMQEWQGESAATDPRTLLLRWVGDRLGAAHRLSSPTFFHIEGETDDRRRAREAEEKAYYQREEASIQRAQNFGKRINAQDGEGIWAPMSYSVNRALVLETHEDDRQVDGDRKT